MTDRAITAAVETATKAENLQPFYMVELDLDGGLINVTNIDRTIVWNSKTWTGVGAAGGLVGIKESADLSVSGVKLLLSGIGATYWNTVLTADYSGRRCTIWAAFLDANDAIIANPIIIFEGQLDTIEMEAGSTGAISLSAENELVRWQKPKEFRYTNADQQERFPGDVGFEFVAQVMEKELLWGPVSVASQQFVQMMIRSNASDDIDPGGGPGI